MKSRITLSILIIFSFILGSCGTPESHSIEPIDSTNLIPFSSKSFSTLYQEESNMVYSPVSAYLALRLCSEDAIGETRHQIQQTLNDSTVSIPSLLHQFNKDDALSIRSSIWYDQSVSLSSSLQDAADQYQAKLFQKNFKKEAVSKQISAWISDETNDTLSPALPIAEDTKMIYLNMVYFKDSWLVPFFQHKSPQDFTNALGNTSSIPFLHGLFKEQPYIENEQYTAVQLAFEDGATLSVYLPTQGHTIRDILADESWITSFQTQNVKKATVALSLPAFSQQQHHSIKDMLKKLGIHRGFDPDLAQFASKSNHSSIYIDDVYQGVSFSLNETGAQAAAYTEIEMKTTGISEYDIAVTLDHPFLYVLSTEEGIPLMIGYLQDPQN